MTSEAYAKQPSSKWPDRTGAKRHLLYCAVAEAKSVHTFERGFLVTSILCPGSAAPRQDHDSDTGLGTNILLCNSLPWLGPGSLKFVGQNMKCNNICSANSDLI